MATAEYGGAKLMATWNEAENKWEGDGQTAAPGLKVLEFNFYSEIPDPVLTPQGTIALVKKDPDESLNGLHFCSGQYWMGV